MSTVIDLTGGNSSPVSSLPPIISIGKNSLNSFAVPAIDNEGDTLRYRLATSSEAGGSFIQPGPPHATNALSIDSGTGIVSWDTSGATLSEGSVVK